MARSEAGAAVAETGQPEVAMAVASDIAGPEGTVAVAAPMQGTIVSLDVAEGDACTPVSNSSSWKR